MSTLALPTFFPTQANPEGFWSHWDIIVAKVPTATLETIEMTGIATLVTLIIGLPLGLALVSTARDGLAPNRVIHSALSVIVNIGRSMPFVVLMIALIPLTRLLTGTSLGWQAATVPLTVGAIPFFARLVETSVREVAAGKVEAALMVGASRLQVTRGVLVREALPSLVAALSVTLITLVSFSAMAGLVGGGGLGALAYNYGYSRYMPDVMLVTVVVIVVLVQIVQLLGDIAVRSLDHRH